MNIVFALFDMVTQLDFTGPAQILSRLPNATVHVAAKKVRPIQTDSGFSINPSTSFNECPQADILCVPGGFGVPDAIEEGTIVEFFKRQAGGAKYITSVCTGAFILGAAGLLEGKRATTHWAYTDLLKDVGARYTEGRVVVDGNTYTGGGVTAGIDFALMLASEVAGKQVSASLELGFEYNPMPPNGSGHPSIAPDEIAGPMKDRYVENVGMMAKAIA
ncbi:DJ-1/PfpI family protein [Kordiimonas sp. SCSIO 12610]|uniref:DJ-1/PfpI family protein n=1 Tax=Kordiimonas sp. SCSIO 12610 TaxID=2829597 RepID=UPI00210DF1DE|nr:DJ-1/PfpI family protein [Kordiimonas sp. SCSIO 12610]UTW56767.1 DJ-1/PfpI family protein [Kordiimonas sp. SCSIO 12610]